MTGDEKRLVVVHLGFLKTDKDAKNNLQSLVQLKPYEMTSHTEINDV